MRIGVNCFLLQRHIGGLRQYFLQLFRELLARDDGDEYVFFWYRHNAEELEHLGTDRWRRHAILLDDQRQVRAHLDRIDLYFCPLPGLYPRPIPRPTVMTLADVQEVFFPEFFSADDRYTRALHFPGSTRMADRVITISEYSRRTIVEHHRLAPERVAAIHLCADERFARGAAIARPPQAALPARFVFYPANVWKHKNHEALLRAIRLLRDERGRRVDLVLTGFATGEDDTLASLVAAHGLGDQVHALGYLDVEEMVHVYLHADLLVFPSLFEGFGIPLVEAMTVGCPIAAANATSIPELTGDAAALFDPTSPAEIAAVIERALDDHAWREALRARGFARARAFSAAAMADRHRAVFREAVRAYTPRDYLWRRWIAAYAHRAQLEWAWRAHRPRSPREWAKAGREWLRDPVG